MQVCTFYVVSHSNSIKFVAAYKYCQYFCHWLDDILNRFKTQTRVGVYALHGHFGYVEMIWFSEKNASYFPLCALASYVVNATTSGVPTAVQGGVYAVGAGGYGGFYQHGWQHNLRVGPPPLST